MQQKAIQISAREDATNDDERAYAEAWNAVHTRSRRRASREQVLLTLLVGIALAAILQITIQNYIVEGDSMLPTVQTGDRVLIDRLAYTLGSPARGDIVVFHTPPQISPPSTYIKRIIGLPGDTVSINPGQVWVNGRLLKEAYLQPARTETYSYPPTRVPSGEYFVLGDNRIVSYDSHAWGFLPAKDLYGRVMVTYWPVADFHLYGV